MVDQAPDRLFYNWPDEPLKVAVEYVRRDLLTREAVAEIVKPLVDIAYRSGAAHDEGVDHLPAVRQILALLDPKEPT